MNVSQQNIICPTCAGARRKWAAKELLIRPSSGCMDIICIFNSIQDNVYIMVITLTDNKGNLVCGQEVV